MQTAQPTQIERDALMTLLDEINRELFADTIMSTETQAQYEIGLEKALNNWSKQQTIWPRAVFIKRYLQAYWFWLKQLRRRA